MIKSMTGFGLGKYESNSREYTVEIKAVNHRYNDISIRMPRYLSSVEDKIRSYISKNLSRGKIDVSISLVNMSNEGRNIRVDKGLAEIYVKEMRELVSTLGITDDITATSIMRMPDIVTIDVDSDEELYWNELQKALEMAIKNISLAREVEGKRLADDIKGRLTKISYYVQKAEERSSSLLEEYREKLLNRAIELKANEIMDENRLGQEIVLFADKSSICEEVTRLKSHIKSLENMLDSVGPIGKKLDFLLQEMNRETNTIGSKANCLDITQLVVEMKNEIENIREQIQNIE